MSRIKIEPGPEREPSRCACCGQTVQIAQGFIYSEGEPHAVYFADWCEAHGDRRVSICLGLGRWDAGSCPGDRRSVGLEARATSTTIQFEVLEPEQSPWSGVTLVGPMMTRAEALAHPLIEHIFHLVERVTRGDPRVSGFLEG